MGASAIPIIVMTLLWGAVGIGGPFFAPKNAHRGVFQTCLILTAACCWLFWLCAYMAQMNPLIGPSMHNTTLLIAKREWGGNPNVPTP